MFRKKKPNLGLIIAGLICIILGAAAFYAAYTQASSWNRFKQTAVQTTAVITDIQKHRTRTRSHGKTKTKTRYEVTVTYNVDGQDYSTQLGYHTSLMRIGGEVPIYYDPAEPSYSMTDPSKRNIVIYILGGVFILCGALMIILDTRNCILVNSLIRNNKYIMCDNWTEQKSGLTVNGTPYNCIVCNYKDEYSGKEYVFTSSSYHPNRSVFVSGLPVKIYVDTDKNPKVYFVSDEGH